MWQGGTLWRQLGLHDDAGHGPSTGEPFLFFFLYKGRERKKELLSGLDFFTSLFSSFFRPSFSSFRTGILHSASRHKKCVSIDIKSCCCDNSAGQDWLIPIGRRRRRSRRKFIPYTYISIHRDTPYKGGGSTKTQPPEQRKKGEKRGKGHFWYSWDRRRSHFYGVIRVHTNNNTRVIV